MRIARLNLKAFRSFVDVEVPLDAPRVFICGLNETGKSTIRESIKYLLTGICQGTDERGRGVETCAPMLPGVPQQVFVGADLDPVGHVERGWDPKGAAFRVAGFTGTSQTQQMALFDKLQTNPAFLDAVLDSSVFLRLHHADAKGLVLALLNVRITLGEGDGAQTYSLAELDELYDAAFEDRKLAKKKLAGLVVPEKPADKSLPKLEDVEKLLKQRRAELNDLHRQRGTTAGRRDALLAQKARLTASPAHGEAISDLSDQIHDLEERLAIMEETAAPAEPAPMQRPSKRTAHADATEVQARIETLETFAPTKGCIIDGKIPCQTNRLKFRNRARDLAAELQAREPQEAETPAPTLPETAESPLTTVRKELQALQDRQAIFVAGTARRDELATVEAELAAIPDTTAVDQQIAEWQTRIEKGEAVRREVLAYQQVVKAYETAAQAITEARAEVDRLEQLVSTLGPTGVRVEALKQAMGTFEQAVNLFTAPYQMQVSFALDPWDVVVNGRSVRTYSASQQYRIGIAIQLAIAGMSGLRFAIVDTLDVLDQVKRDTMVRTLFREAPVDQLILLATREPSQPLPQVPGLLAYRLALQEGRSVVVERSAA